MKKRDFIIFAVIVGLIAVFALFARSAVAANGIDEAIESAGQSFDVSVILGLVAKVLVGVMSPLATIFIIAFLITFFNNTVKRFIGRAAFKRHGLSIKDRIREGTSVGSVVLCIHRTAFDGFYGTVIEGGDKDYDEEKFIPWIGFETREVVLIRNYDPKNGEPKSLKDEESKAVG